ncbi:MAG: ATP-binding protein [Spongiibacteraceae bacterium]
MTKASNTANNNDQQQNHSLLKIYTVYRVLLSCALLSTFFLSSDKSLLGQLKPEQFIYTAGFYLLINLIGLLLILPKKIPFNSQQLFVNFLFDITIVIILTDASNGVASGLGMLLVVIVAASSIMLRGQLALLSAAFASLAIIADTSRLITGGSLPTSSFLPAGLLGMVFFITAFLIHTLAVRIRGAQTLAAQRAIDVEKLQTLNQNIVQRMRTGIIVVDQLDRVQLANTAARELLAIPKNGSNCSGEKPSDLNTQLLLQLHQWRQSPYYQTPLFRASETGPELQASFSALADGDDGNTDTLIFIEDNRRIAQQAQQIKLASLGRLTASIAHEIRNPLGAISHAAQLLAESEQLDSADQRLSEIIQKHSKRMNNVIENVLQLSTRSAPNPEKFDLNKWLQQFIDEFENNDHDSGHNNDQVYKNFNITLTSDQPCEVTMDCSQLNQVLTNLAQNGLRYSLQQTGRATLQFHSQINPSTGLAVLDIIDDGPGIEQQALGKLFEPFYTTEVKGSGLGLYISRELCEANEARLDYLRNNKGKSCFRISFPHPDRRLSPE